MNAVLWIVQSLLALHTAVGAGWKMFQSEKTVPSLARLPHPVWIILAGLEALCALALVLPAVATTTGYLVPIAALAIALEMLGFSVLHWRSPVPSLRPVFYWLAVAAVGVLVAYGRFALHPL